LIRISRINLKNFKSFRRASIPIPQGFTAIVGPNGSGKSNIVDAICFVLGRSSAKSLRAERFSDLIFNGGKKGKPAKNAEVTLFFDNAGLELSIGTKEVKVSRSIDHKGNSVYRLNDKRTTRTEILELLAEANVHPDGHNIVLQGDVTGIIEMNPVERRRIIDEIAGIAEYDEKKRKALRELEKVEDNLGKVEAVLEEVGEQAEKLRKEKEDALRHAHLKKEIRRSRGLVLTSKELEARIGIERLEDEIAQHEMQGERLSRHISILQLKLETKKKEVEKLNTKIILKEETENFEVFKEIEKVKNEASYLQREVESRRSKLYSLGDERKKAELSIDGLTQEIRDYTELNGKLREEAAELGKRIDEIRSIIKEKYSKLVSRGEEESSRKEQLLETVDQLESAKEELHSAEKRKTVLEERMSSLKKAREALMGEVNQLKKELENVQSELAALQKQRAVIEKAIDRDYHLKQDLINKRVEVKKRLDRASILLARKQEELTKLEERARVVDEITRGAASRAVREILKLRDSGEVRGIFGTIAELGRVKPEYAKALEAAAGSGMDFVVVDTDSTAEKCITYLKDNRLGRTSFLPLNKINPRPPTPDARKVGDKFRGFALRHVKFDKRFLKAFALVLRNTVVVDDVASARKHLGKARMVTLDGDLIEVSGLMSGGYFKSRREFRTADESRDRLSSLRAETDGLREEHERLRREEMDIARELEDLNSREVKNARDLDVLRERVKTLEGRIAQLREAAAEKEVDYRDLGEDARRLEEELTTLDAEASRLKEVLDGLQRSKEALEEELSISRAEEALEELRALEEELSRLEEQRTDRMNKIRLNESRIREILEPKIAELRRHLELTAKESERIRGELTAAEERMEKLQGRLSSLEEEAEEVMQEINELKARRRRCGDALRAIDDKIRDLRERLEDENRGRERARIEKAKLETRLEETLEALKGYADLDLRLDEPFDTSDLERKIAEMEAEMTSLEPINMRAVEDYEEVKEKYEKLRTRVDVLIGEKEAILELMEEIEHRKKMVFMEVFDGVAANFRAIFERLSPGGSADLILDEDNPLDGGLQIQAKPAGKNPQYIELMSGGEKTLTALSFIFAIQRFQPAPFYVLDEIDMFLDDDNVRKISELIKESSRDAQFIVVSLRSGLMASADQLFGVTNDEGISRIIGVELAQHGG
jgi:chromosome segregation protein